MTARQREARMKNLTRAEEVRLDRDRAYEHSLVVEALTVKPTYLWWMDPSALPEVVAAAGRAGMIRSER